MKVTVSTLNDEIFVLDVSEDLELENFKAFCEIESGFPASDITLSFNGKPMIHDKKSLKELGVHDGDVIVMLHMVPLKTSSNIKMTDASQALPSGLASLDFSNIQVPQGASTSMASRSATVEEDPRIIREMFLANPDQLALLKQNNPRLADALLTGNLDTFASVLREQISARTQRQQQRISSKEAAQVVGEVQRGNHLSRFCKNGVKTSAKVYQDTVLDHVVKPLSNTHFKNIPWTFQQDSAPGHKAQTTQAWMMNSDPFDTEAQRMIAEEIRQKNIEANMEAAMEYNPETFGTVVMLYINCHVNGFPVKAFIDSGAQTTIMSAACAERCNIMRLVDTRWAGIAKGVGVQRIIGRIHMVQMRIEKDFLTTSFSVLEEQPMDMLLGLDMLKRHQCNIDLKRNILHIGTTGTETPFLSEAELPECARLSGVSEEDLTTQTLKDSEIKAMKEALEKSKRDRPNPTPRAPRGPRSSRFYVPPHYTGPPLGPGPRVATSGLSNPNLLILPTDTFNENDVEEIMSLGFTREQAVVELRRFNGDKTQATVALFAKSLKF